ELHEGKNITCLFDHPKFPHRALRTVTLPAFYLSAVRLLNPGLADSSNESQAVESVVLEEGQSNTTIGLEVIGDVPRYSIVCTKEERSLPEGVAVIGSALTLQGPVELYHAGLYESPPNITIQSSSEWEEDVAYTLVQCTVDSVGPAATISWSLGDRDSDNSTSQLTEVQEQVQGQPELHANGSVTVRSMLRFPTSMFSGQNVTCVVHHLGLERPERRGILLCGLGKLIYN
ncbi:unnamed protein product, partial [Coregonus sp. 'balchen']